MDKEVWKDIPGYEEKYQASDYGRIRSLIDSCSRKRLEPLILKQKIRVKGKKYRFVSLSKDSIVRYFAVHRLILMAFVGPCPPGMECRHLDGDSSNNRLDNLKWGTRAENLSDRVKHDSYCSGVSSYNAKLNPEKVRQIRYLNYICGWSYQRIADIYGVARATIRPAARRITWKRVT